MGGSWSLVISVDDPEFIPTKQQFEACLRELSKHDIVTITYPEQEHLISVEKLDEKTKAIYLEVQRIDWDFLHKPVSWELDEIPWSGEKGRGPKNAHYSLFLDLPIHASFWGSIASEMGLDRGELNKEYVVMITSNTPCSSPMTGESFITKFIVIHWEWGHGDWEFDEAEKIFEVFKRLYASFIQVVEKILQRKLKLILDWCD